MLDLDAMPADWELAQQHAKAVRPGISRSFYMKKRNNLYCKCCLKPVEKQPVPLAENSKQLQFLGFGFPLYFIFSKYSIILVLLLIFNYCSISLYWAVKSNQQFCSNRLLSSSVQGDNHCTSFFVMLSRIQTSLSQQQIILRISSFLLHLFALIYIRDNIRKTYEYYDERSKSLAHYSLVFKKLPLKNGIQKCIRNFINKHFLEEWQQCQEEFINSHFKLTSQKVKEIILVPDFTEYLFLERKKNQLIQRKRKILKENSQELIQSNMSTLGMVMQPSPQETENQNQNSKISLQLLDQKMKKIKRGIEQKKIQILQKVQKDQLHAETAIVILNTQIFKDTILKFSQSPGTRLDKSVLGKYFGDFLGQIEILKAAQPNEIIWENICYSSRQKLIRRIVGWTLSIIFLAFVTVGFYFILIAKTNVLLTAMDSSLTHEEYHNSKYYFLAEILVFLLMFLTVIFNKTVMSQVLKYFTSIEKHQTTSDLEFSFCVKYTLGLFFTTALMTLAVEAITFHNFYQHQYGVIEQQSIMFLLNALFVPLFMLVNPFQLKVLLIRKLNKGKKHFTQSEANKIMQDYPYSMGKEYAQIIESLYFTFLYASIIPLGAFIMVVGLGLYYWVSKYNLLRRSSLRHNISGEMALCCLKLLDLTLLMKPAGEIIFDSSIRDGYSISSVIMVCVSIVYFLLPMNKILDFFHDEKFHHSKKTYEQVKDRFVETYETLHPIFNQNALRDINIKMVFNNKPKQTEFAHMSVPWQYNEEDRHDVDHVVLQDQYNIKNEVIRFKQCRITNVSQKLQQNQT